MKLAIALFLGLVAVSVVVSACSGSTTDGPAAEGAGTNSMGAQAGTAGNAGNAAVSGEGGHAGDVGGQVSSLMWRAKNCEDLTSFIQERLRTVIADAVLVGTGGSSAWVVGVPSPGGGTGGASSGGGSPSGGNQGVGGSNQAPVCERNGAPPYTQVNAAALQPVATDGERLYLAQGGQMRVIDAQAADSLAELSSSNLVRGDQALFVLDGATAQEKTLVVLSTTFDEEVATSAGRPSASGCLPETFSKATVLRLADGTVTLDAEYFYQGNLVTAWSGASGVRQLLATLPPLPAGLRITPTAAEASRSQELLLQRLDEQGLDAAELTPDELKLAYREAVTEVLAEANAAVISSVRGEDWLPKAFVRRDGALEALPFACTDVYIPQKGTLGDGVTFVASLEGPSGPGISALLGSSPTVYQRDGSLVLGSPIDYQLIEYAPTYLHAFDVDGDDPFIYRGSGYVDARVADPWSIDGDAASLRVVGDQSVGVEGPHGRLFTLGAEQGELELRGESEPFHEAAGAARFVGDTALVMDGLRLLTIDLSLPEAPRIVSESDLAHITDDAQIIDEQHVLTIEPANGYDFGLQLIDISDRTTPNVVSSFDLELGINNLLLTKFDRKFTYDRASGMLTMSFSGIDDVTTANQGFGTLNNWVALFSISPSDGIRPLGRLEGAHLEGLLTETTCNRLPYDAARFDWTFLLNGALFGVARQAVVAAPLEDLEQRSTLLLQECAL